MDSLADLQTNPCMPQEMWMKEHWEDLYPSENLNNLERKGFVVSLCIRVLAPSWSTEHAHKNHKGKVFWYKKCF